LRFEINLRIIMAMQSNFKKICSFHLPCPFGSRIRRGGEGRGGILTEGREGEEF